jgi:serpin B
MMQREGAALTTITDEADVVDLPYGGGAFSMTILVPRQGRSVNDLIASLTPAMWSALTAQLTEGDLRLTMPKFRLEWNARLNDELQALGMRDAFQPARANFSALSDDPTYISWVVQKTFVDVNEVGTEAAAVTGVGVDVVCACGPREIRIDRPFVFAIRERLSGTILFVAKIANPAATA